MYGQSLVPLLLPSSHNWGFIRWANLARAQRSRFRGHPSMSNSCWISALRLSHIWGFAIVRAKVIAVLRGSTLGMIQRLNLANEFQITEWIRPAYQHLLTREESLKESDVPWLGPRICCERYEGSRGTTEAIHSPCAGPQRVFTQLSYLRERDAKVRSFGEIAGATSSWIKSESTRGLRKMGITLRRIIS